MTVGAASINQTLYCLVKLFLFFNQEMERTVELVVYRIFNFMKKAVVRIVMDFVQDSNGRIWLLGSRDCVVVSERKPDRCAVCCVMCDVCAV